VYRIYLTGHHVISLLKQLGTLRTNFGILLISGTWLSGKHLTVDPGISSSAPSHQPKFTNRRFVLFGQMLPCMAVFTCVRTRHPHTSSAHAIRFCHPHGVFTCVRVLHPSNMLNIEFLFCLSVVLYHCFYGKVLKCVKCECYMCKSCSWSLC